MDNKAEWIRDISHNWGTPGGDPLWICSNCGGGRHLYGIEYNIPLDICPDCYKKMEYNYEKINCD